MRPSEQSLPSDHSAAAPELTGASQLPVGTVTFMLTDVEGSTFLWESAAAAMGAAIQLYDEVVTLAGDSAAVFRCEGECWTIRFQRVVVHLRDAKVLHYLRRLLAVPGREFHVLDLTAGTTPAVASPAQRARSNVTKSLRACLKRIATAYPVLGAHLAATVRTGYFCSYQPDPCTPLHWQT